MALDLYRRPVFDLRKPQFFGVASSLQRH